MKRNKQKKAARKGTTQPTLAAQVPLSRRRLFILAAVLGTAGLVATLVLGPSPPQPPSVSISSLDKLSASAMESRLAAVRNAPRSAEAWGTLGELLRSYEFGSEAIECFRVAERLAPAEPRWPYLHSLAVTTSDPTLAMTLMRRSVALGGNKLPVPRLKLAKMLAEAGNWTEAGQHLETLLRAHPDLGPAWLLLAQTAQGDGHLDKAVDHAKRAVQDRRSARSAWTLLSVLHQRLGQTNETVHAARQAAAAPADAPMEEPFETVTTRADARDLSDRVQRLLASGRLDEAAPLVQQLARDHSGSAETWLLTGRWQLLRRDAAAAEQSLRRHLVLEPGSPNGAFQLGMALLALNRFDEASASFRKAIELKADPGPAFYNLGFALARAGKTREAIEPFRQSIKHNPERADSYILLADLHAQLGEKSEAQTLLRQAEAINANDRRLPALRSRISGL